MTVLVHLTFADGSERILTVRDEADAAFYRDYLGAVSVTVESLDAGPAETP